VNLKQHHFLVVEFDGYLDHTTRRAFISDRHGDYELTLTGFTLLRLANDQIARDFGKVIEKVRDMERLCGLRTRWRLVCERRANWRICRSRTDNRDRRYGDARLR
jgi:hypothetical protein